MKPRIFPRARFQTWRLPCASAEVWEPVWLGHRLITRLGLLLEVIEDQDLTPIRCLILAHIGRADGLGVHASRLARELSVPRATLHYHIDLLQRAGLIWSKGPGPHDGRRQRFVLTQLGTQTLDRAAALLVELTAGGEWPRAAPRRDHWSLRRLGPESAAPGHIKDDPYPGVSSWTPPPGDRGAARRAPSR